MIESSDRNALILYRLNQAFENIELARFLLRNEKLEVAANRIYYGMFYVVTALALKYKYETSKHSQLIGWFNQEFIAKGKVNQDLGRILKNAFKNRTKGDYDAYIQFSIPEIESMIIEMERFIIEIEKLISL